MEDRAISYRMDFSREWHLRMKSRIEFGFEPFLKSAEQGHPFNWNAISQVVETLDSDMKCSEFLHKFFDFVLRLLERYKCTDVNSLGQIINIYCLFKGGLTPFTRRCTNAGKIYDSTYFLGLMKLKYGKFKVCMLDPVRIALSCGDDDWLDFFIQRGFVFVPPVDASCEWELVHRCFLIIIGEFNLEVPFNNEHDLFVEISRHYGTEARKRLLMVLMGFQVLALFKPFRRSFINRSQSVLCLQKIFQTIPEPHITSQEIREFLHRIIYNSNAEEKAIQEICEEYERDFPKSRQLKQPRSLLHLSRCQVRQNLRRAGTILHGVNQLHLSKVMEEYVLLQNYETYKPYLN